jgi:hypothetical protein
MGVYINAGGTVVSPVYTFGLAIAVQSKGYVYSEKPLSPLVTSLDKMPKDLVSAHPDGVIAYKKFRKNWYIYRYTDRKAAPFLGWDSSRTLLRVSSPPLQNRAGTVHKVVGEIIFRRGF